MQLSLIKFIFPFLLIIVAFPNDALSSKKGNIEIMTKEGPVRFSVEYAITQEEKAKGLMHRRSLPHKHGMMFVYQKPRDVTMWMKDTPLSLDMFFITRRGHIRKIAVNTQPNSLKHILSEGKVSAVLELRAGSAADFGIKVGDTVRIIN